MTIKKIIAVVGATGLQGGSVAKYLLEDGYFAVRALTRNSESPAAKGLKAAGADVVAADLEDLKSLKKAFEGVHGVFGLTDFWTLYQVHNFVGPEAKLHEEQHGRNLVDAAVSAGVKHFLWSTLEQTPGVGAFHWDAKFTVDQYLKSKPLPRTSLYTAFYFENLTKIGMLKKEDDGSLVVDICLPSDTKLLSFSAAETGGWALTAFKNPDEWIGKDMHLIGEAATVVDYANAVRTIAGGNTVKLKEVSHEEFNTPEYRASIDDELWLNQKAFIEGFCVRDLDNSKQGYPKASSLLQFVQNDAALRVFVTEGHAKSSVDVKNPIR